MILAVTGNVEDDEGDDSSRMTSAGCVDRCLNIEFHGPIESQTSATKTRGPWGERNYSRSSIRLKDTSQISDPQPNRSCDRARFIGTTSPANYAVFLDF